MNHHEKWMNWITEEIVKVVEGQSTEDKPQDRYELSMNYPSILHCFEIEKGLLTADEEC